MWNRSSGTAAAAIVGGYQRFKVLVQLGEKEVDCVVVDMDELNARLEELGQEMMGLVRLNERAGTDTSAYETEYARVSQEMDLIKERKIAIEEAELSELMRQKRIEEMSNNLNSTETPFAKFDAALFRRLVEKVVIHSLVEATFIFRSGIELREILG